MTTGQVRGPAIHVRALYDQGPAWRLGELRRRHARGERSRVHQPSRAVRGQVLTGGENLVLMARLRRVKDAGHVADDLLTRFQLTDAAGRRVAT